MVESLDIELGHSAETTTSITGSKPLKAVAENTFMEKIAGVIAATAVGSSLVAIIVEGSSVVIIAGILSSLCGPYAYWQQTRLTDIKTLKETHEAVVAEVDRLHVENARLEESVTRLSSSVERLEDVEQALDTISRTQGKNIKAFEQQVEDNRKILARMKRNHRAAVLQNILTVVIGSDKDGDFKIDEGEELNSLITRIQSISGVIIDETKFRNVIRTSGGELEAVMDIIKDLLDDEAQEKPDAIFKFEKQ